MKSLVFHILAMLFSLLLSGLAHAEKLVSVKDLHTFTKDMHGQTGYFNFFYQPQSGKVYLEVDKFDHPFIFLNSMPYGIGSNDIGLDRGQLGKTRLVQFERYGDKVLLKQLNTSYRASTKNPEELLSVDEAFADSVLQGFRVEAETQNRKRVIIDYTPFLLSDIHGVSNRLLEAEKDQGNFKVDDSRSAVYMPRSKAFPENTELEAMITFSGTKPGKFLKQVTPSPESITIHLHHSLIKAPNNQYKPRRFHPNSGYYSVEYKDYASPIDRPMEQRFIRRHRLTKKDPGAKVSEAVDPIIYYLDPGAPEPIRSALLEGARWWDQAFQAIGYKNAFQVKMLPSGADPMDVRYNVIQWVHRATRGWSYGESVFDPRTGEILKGQVTLGSLRVRQDYLIAQGLSAPFANDDGNTEELKEFALARMKQLAAHEVGHTLGIVHNFAASANQAVSVMDYPHPNVTVINGQLSLSNAYPEGIGKWDMFVISYGYSEFSDDQGESNQLAILLKSAKDQGLEFISDPDSRPIGSAHVMAHLWDNGEDPVDELHRIFKIRSWALKNFGLSNIPNGTPLSQLEEVLIPIYLFHRYQTEAVAKLIGGIDYSYEVKDHTVEAFGVKPVSARQQKRAIEAVLQTVDAVFLQLSKKLVQLIPPKAYGYARSPESFKSRTGLTFDPVSAAESAATQTLNLLLHEQRLNRLSHQAMVAVDLPDVSYLISQLINSTIKSLFVSDSNKDIQERVAQITIETIMTQIANQAVSPEVKAVLFAHMRELGVWLKEKLIDAESEKFRYIQFLTHQLDWYMKTGMWTHQLAPLTMPPGSPI